MSLDEIKRRINITKESGANKLDLSRIGITELPFTDLAILSNQLTSIDISSNNINAELAVAITLNFKNLTALYVYNNDIGDDGATAISQNLKNLTTLYIGSNNISNNGAIAISQNLKNLAVLYINGNDIGDEGVIAISQNLKNLTILNVWSNNIGDDGAEAISQNLKNLERLDIRINRIGDRGLKLLYESFKDSLNIKIDITGNDAKAIPPSATNSWDNLKQYFVSIKENTVTLNALNILLLGNTFSGKSSLQDFYLDNNGVFIDKNKDQRTWGISHKTVNNKPIGNLRLSFWDFGGQEYFHGTHRLFIGGRNALYLVLWESRYETSSDEAVISQVPLKNENGDDCYPAAYWLGTIRHFDHGKDIAGRVIVAQSKIDIDQTNKWPSFLTKKRFGLHPENYFNLSARGASDKGAAETKNYHQALWSVFKSRFEQLIMEQKSSYEFNENMLKILGGEGLIKWRIEKNLSIPKREFLKLCHQFYEGADDFIMQYLQDCGEILLFKDNALLKDKVFICPETLLNNIYDILNKEVKEKGGVFSGKEIEGKESLLDVMLEMDLVFENPTKEGEYVAPQFMHENAEISKLLIHLRKLLKIAFSLRFPDFMPRGYITRFIAQKGKLAVDGVYWKFGVLYHYKTINGVEIKVLVEADENNRFIRVYADDKPGKYDALKEVFNQFAFYDNPISENKVIPNESINPFALYGAKADANKTVLIPTKSGDDAAFKLESKELRLSSKRPIEHLELSADGENYASINEIGKAIDQNAGNVRNIKGDYIPLNSIFHVLLNKVIAMPKKIFFSYSRYDREYREEFDVHFATLKRQGLIATWYDGVIEPGVDANAEIMRELENADIILCLLSPQFMANDYIWNIEMAKAKKAEKPIVPISIRACDYKKYFADYFGEDKQGFLTQKQFDRGQTDVKTKERDIIWIASEQHPAKRDEYYNFIVDGLRKIIER